jgi:hypothetical protein
VLPVDVGNLPPGNLIHLAGNAKLGWYLVHQKGNDVTLFYSRQLEGGDWQAARGKTSRSRCGTAEPDLGLA